MLNYQRVIKPCCNGQLQITEAQYRILRCRKQRLQLLSLKDPLNGKSLDAGNYKYIHVLIIQ